MRLNRRLLTCAAAALAVAATTALTPPAHAAGVRVWPLGDSITWGTAYRYGDALPEDPVWRTRIVASPGGYRVPLSGLLASGGLVHEFVGTNTDNPGKPPRQAAVFRHNGHRGYRIQDTSNALTGRAGNGKGDDLGGYWLTGNGAAQPPIYPDVTIVHLGTNDIAEGDLTANLGDPAQRAALVDLVGDRLQDLVDRIQLLRPDTAIVLSTVLPMLEPGQGVTAADYNDRVRAIAAAEAGEGVFLADPWSLFAARNGAGGVDVKPGLISPDTVHPTPAGYALLAAVYRDPVRAAAAW